MEKYENVKVDDTGLIEGTGLLQYQSGHNMYIGTDEREVHKMILSSALYLRLDDLFSFSH